MGRLSPSHDSRETLGGHTTGLGGSICGRSTANNQDYQHCDPHSDQVGHDVANITRAALDKQPLDQLTDWCVHGRDHGSKLQSAEGKHSQHDRHGEDGDVDDLVGIRERRRPTKVRRVEHLELNHHRGQEGG